MLKSLAGLISHINPHHPKLPFDLNKSMIYPISCKLEKLKQVAVLSRNQEAQHLVPYRIHTVFKMLKYKYFSYRKAKMKQRCIFTSILEPLHFFIQAREKET